MKQLDPGASPQEWFGTELRRLRLEQGLSARALGRLVQVSDDMILAIEKGKYPSCRRDVVQRLDDALGTGGLLDRAWPMVFGSRHADRKRADADKASTRRGEGAVQASAGRILGRDEPTLRPGSQEPVIRRSFLQIGGLAAIAPLNFTDVFAPRNCPSRHMSTRATSTRSWPSPPPSVAWTTSWAAVAWCLT
ncbi:helix-turn-helix domain-containing protein [Streptomyces microflavus]|uniref:helix-turn-helix domain-containing protein n=1 Tax=Streptomyces microflavus TaxID=1919 RepID=UPI00365F8AC1